MSWVYVIIGIISLIALQSLRGALSLEFPKYAARPTRRPEARRFGGLELIDAKTTALSALGFEGPGWIEDNPDANGPAHSVLHAVYRNTADHVVAWVGPTAILECPHQLLTYYTTLLDDGRYAVTQVSDPYFESVDDPRTPAQTIAPSDEASEIELHKQFVSTLGNPAVRPSLQEDVVRFAGEHMTAIRSRLIERGRIVESDGIARPSLSFAFRLMRKMLSRPMNKTPDTSPVPTARLSYLAGTVERGKHRAPSQAMQWLLLTLSGVLFAGIGWPFLGLEITLVILGTIVFHEAGHWAAMRLFGYGNPHITLLPLLGGVTIGHETDPSAAKRAWVALAGPLPGIVLGWSLIYFVGFGNIAVLDMGEWVLPTVITLLFVNYLNVLPIPPLDGSHIVQAILPPRWIVIQIAIVFVGVAIGAYVAWLLEFWPLALIAALQLLGLKSLWRESRLVRRFVKSPPPVDLDETGQTEWLLNELDTELGAPKTAASRIGLANSIRTQLNTQPMGGLHRTVISAIYVVLVAVPVAALLVAASGSFIPESSADVESMYEEYDADYEALTATAAELDSTALIAEFASDDAPLEPASEGDIVAAESRLGRPLPDHLRAFYLLTNGIPRRLGLGPVDTIRPVDPETFRSGDLMYYVYEGDLYFYNVDLGDVAIPVAETDDWWYIGSNEDWLSHVYVDPTTGADEASVFMLGDGDMSAYKSMREFLEEAWVEERSIAIYDEHAQRLNAKITESLDGLTIEQLVEEIPEPSYLVRLINLDFSAPVPASAEALAAAAANVGYPLPAGYRRALEVRNGISEILLMPVEDIRPARELSDISLERAVEIANSAEAESFTEQDIAACWVIAGHVAPSPEYDGSSELYARLLWCPQLDEEYRYLSFMDTGFKQSFEDIIREQLVMLKSF